MLGVRAMTIQDIFGDFFDKWAPGIYEHPEAAIEFAIALARWLEAEKSES